MACTIKHLQKLRESRNASQVCMFDVQSRFQSNELISRSELGCFMRLGPQLNNWIIKHVIREPSCLYNPLCHTQFICFISIFSHFQVSKYDVDVVSGGSRQRREKCTSGSIT